MAKTEHYFTQFEIGGVYHVYNRSVDRKPMFKSDENYAYFIRQFDKYLSSYVKIYAYCLLDNHFHFLIKIVDFKGLTAFQILPNSNAEPKREKTTHEIVSHQFKKFFQSYAMAFNKQHDRVGTLFQTPFKRVQIIKDDDFKNLICYINTNAQKHNLVSDFKNWKWSSYQNLTTNKTSKLLKEEVIEIFGGCNNLVFSLLNYNQRITSPENEIFIED